MQELTKSFLIKKIREQVQLNQVRGDKKSFHGSEWPTYGGDIDSYEKSFDGVLNGRSIRSLLEDKPFFVVIDLMGPSDTIATLFKAFSDKPKLGLAISLEDLRSTEQKARDRKLKIEQIVGDTLKSFVWNEIKKKLPKDHKADLIMERAMTGHNCIPSDTRLYAMLLNKAWSLLSKDSGVLIAEIPDCFVSEATRMIDNFGENSKMNAIIGRSRYFPSYSIKIVKIPNSPNKLPF